MTDEEITQAARDICALQAWKHDSLASQNYLSGEYDHTVWMRLVEQGIRKGVEQHEAYKQKVSDAVEKVIESCAVTSWGAAMLDPLIIITKPKPDPLVDVLDALKDGRAGPTTESYAHHIRAALDDLGFEIREKGR